MESLINKPKECCLILLVGLPASGKSRLSKFLVSALENSICVEFDKIESSLKVSDKFDPRIWAKSR